MTNQRGQINFSVYRIERNPYVDNLKLLEAAALGIQELPGMEEK